jgi:hypothetical protein
VAVLEVSYAVLAFRSIGGGVAAAVVVLVAGLLQPAVAVAAVAPPFLAYSPDSFFRKPVPASAPLDARSAVGIGYVKSADPSRFPLIRGVEGNVWGMPFAVASCSDPIWKLTGSVPSKVSWLTTQGFHAPSGFGRGLTGTSDSPMVVIDRCGVPAMPGGMTVWAAKAAPGATANTIAVGAGGAFHHSSNGLDMGNPRSNSTKNFRSRGVIPDSMVIRDDLIAAGIGNNGDLGHVLEMFWVQTDSAAGFVHPMTGAESGKSGFGAEGMRIRIRPAVNLESRNCTPAGKVVARTLQRYGAYLGDNSGSGSGFKAQQGSTMITKNALSCTTWDDYEFVQRGWDG